MNQRQSGFALLIVLLTMAFLALIGSQLVAAARSDTRLADDLQQEAKLEAAADGAVARVMFATRAAHDPEFRADGTARFMHVGQVEVSVSITNESDRVNLNTAFAALLRALIVQLAATPAAADQLSAAILDWRSAGTSPRDGQAKALRYLAAGLPYAPPGKPFRSVQELNDVLGVTTPLFQSLAPHLTVLTDHDPDLTTRDPVVSRALMDASGIADNTRGADPATDEVLRIVATATGHDGARFSIMVVASADFSASSPHVNILLRDRLSAPPSARP